MDKQGAPSHIEILIPKTKDDPEERIRGQKLAFKTVKKNMRSVIKNSKQVK